MKIVLVFVTLLSLCFCYIDLTSVSLMCDCEKDFSISLEGLNGVYNLACASQSPAVSVVSDYVTSISYNYLNTEFVCDLTEINSYNPYMSDVKICVDDDNNVDMSFTNYKIASPSGEVSLEDVSVEVECHVSSAY